MHAVLGVVSCFFTLDSYREVYVNSSFGAVGSELCLLEFGVGIGGAVGWGGVGRRSGFVFT